MRKDKFKKFKTKPNSKTEAAKKLRTILFSRFIILALLLILQILFFLMFSLKLQSYIEYYLFASVAISSFFLLYFVNRPGENEFKFALFFPILILPVFGILLYVMYKYNQGGIYLKKKLKKIMDDSAVFIPLKDEAQKITKDFEEVKDILHKSALSLSGGQQQRICIARALAVKPEVLLMDEPTSALDPISTAKIEELMESLKKDYTVVVVTHNMQQALRVSDYTAFFLLGDLIEYEATNKLFTYPRDKRTEDYITGRFG